VPLKAIVAVAIVVFALAALVRYAEPSFAFFPTAGESATPAEIGLAFESSTIVTSDGERLRAWTLPHAVPRAAVVYFHGNGGNLSVWLPILAGVHKHGFTVHAIDYRGYGASTGRPTERGLYRDVDATLDWVSARLDRGVSLVYWGRSLGTTMAAYATSRRRPAGLILEAGFPDARSLLRASPPLAVLGLFSSYRFPTATYAQRAQCPVLVLHGDDDRVIPYALGRELYDQLPEPKSFVRVPGGDHNDVAPADAETYWIAVRTFIDQLTRR
jgi:fermentation-respiration switch protein FrsA (DUF1100 family)